MTQDIGSPEERAALRIEAQEGIWLGDGDDQNVILS
jgi:hypothetical protein